MVIWVKKIYILIFIITIISCLFIYKSNYKKNKEQVINDIIPVNKEIENIPYDPIVYIYNTHQKETYADIGVNFNPTVLDASYTLRDYLEELNIQTYVENSDFYDFLALNNWDYNNLYKVSRVYLLDAMKRYKNIKLFIDLHRDSIKHDIATKTIDNEDYAKVLFVVGLSHDDYKKNLKVAKELNALITKKIGISRGILQKSNANSNGIYNQDLGSNVILIEVGGYQSKYGEVDNTLKILASIIKEYLNG